MQTKENKMGVMPIDKLLISMSLPMMISMLVQALYNIVDSIFVSRINEYALRALGGMSDGSPLLIRAYVKPTPSIFRPQQTVNCSGENTELTIRGRHDPIIVPRAVVVMECMTAITVLDAMMMNMSAKLDSLVEFYR